MSILEKLSCLNEVNLIWNSLPQARLVGGAVRDLLVGNNIADVDMATPEPPELIMETLKNAGIPVIPTGLSHGTVTAIINHHPYEITTLRKDVVTDGRHAQVVWTDSWEEDAARRDFTINAMFCDREGKIWDFYNGKQDLLSGKIRFVGNAKERIEEDVLRSLRFFRFYARYGKQILDEDAVTAIQQTTHLLKNLSAERVWSELKRILTGPMTADIMQMMDHYDVLSALLPFGYDVSFFTKMIQMDAPNHPILRLAGLVTGEGNVISKHLRLSRQEEQLLHALQKTWNIHSQDNDIQLRQLRALFDLELLIYCSWMKQLRNDQPSSEWDRWRERLAAIEQPVFPVKGKDLFQYNVKPGVEMGEALSQIKQWWLQHGCYGDLQDCLEWFKNNKEKRIDINYLIFTDKWFK
ncbi:tRNA nucleotidyltransferase/poly(A) polymerase (PcnB) (PDB:3WFR) [Commensalibacter communis]|uniref:tRNA nucleotidyltransferase/poly(A) polymerase (PcnB) n=1 Tax=Commensalibacter communis TaxID=2972786 RepID=A0A9W4X8N8_9PROT|nr:CCA tRNA nucleotidyltransferase [Commensalibacter communis]CAI3923808.1 tRNA nucleotidyltransferase/poly(A) polymerase (PcnB) (PDB:3WFR) [Commensalibacter communis]CAI3925290.1 tRNA nucleotidyltransferase/poly(A) polymerase (PcnB) (PDB:3WFR) [Commensalibacter communis]CAI3937156.1 tRNA nucleotidyltransferase/poly(A) polymerase (PcnB) (PDB:3WFR) [Commensalibacter communis]CAI3937715.1 tRNA nucleotidyltransferase/poly(A) polymerase (PcnB) (PDB:3WFR) [Commensalibacter communis]